MKKILATLLIMLPVMAMSQPKGEVINIIGLCIGQFQFAETMSSYGEVPFVTMLSMRPKDQTMENYDEYSTVLFVNPDTRTWTFAEKRGEDKFCVVGVGENAAPYVDDTANKRYGT